MPYRRTETVARRLAARQEAILAAAQDLAAEGGMEAVQIASVAQRAGIAAGTVYRYFPSKSELVAALVEACVATERERLRQAAEAAPGPLSALAAIILGFAVRTQRQRRLAFALLAEPVEAEIASVRARYRNALAAEFATRIAAAIDSGHLPDQSADLTAAAILGSLIEALARPTDRPVQHSPDKSESRAVALMCLRALGIADARARGLVVQTIVREKDEDAANTRMG